MHRRLLFAVPAAALALGLVAGCSTQTDPPSGTPVDYGAQSAMPTANPSADAADLQFLADDLPLLPAGVDRAERSVDVVRATYEFAARHPEVLEYVPCFCGCERGGHKGNHDCFVAGRDSSGRVTQWDAHALHCQICLDVARDAMQMHRTGASVAAIRAAIDQKYAGPGVPQTPTPAPPHGGSKPN
jgi:hypothetical protein